MAHKTFALFLVSLLVGFLFCACDAIRVQEYQSKDLGQKQVKDFCVARFYSLRVKQQQYLDYACGTFDCSAIQPNGPCFLPNDLLHHTSYALNVEYRATGVCNKDIGEKTTRDPSHAGCHYP